MIPLILAAAALADPCGMVPPAWVPPGDPGIVRAGEQITWVFYEDGIESVAIRPGFTGTVAEFGMLVPFPTPPSMKKLNDAAFKQLEAAVDPPYVDVTLYDNTPVSRAYPAEMAEDAPAKMALDGGLRYDEVRVLNQEAIGMYEIAVLEAGSPKALERWMTENRYRYPKGMDRVVLDYVRLGWVFVAVKAKVGQMPGVTPHPGVRTLERELPAGANFDGYVQGMVFRFAVDAPVVPMRLSTFNGEAAHNLVYTLQPGPVKLAGLSSEFVMRQVPGGKLHENLVGRLPIRVQNGSASDVPKEWWPQIDAQRDPSPYNGIARDLMGGDLLAVRTGELILPYEKEEKELLNLNEAFGMRGEAADALLEAAVHTLRDQALHQVTRDVRDLTLTVIEGDLPVDWLRENNLTFEPYVMPVRRNTDATWSRRPPGPQVWVPMPRSWFR